MDASGWHPRQALAFKLSFAVVKATEAMPAARRLACPEYPRCPASWPAILPNGAGYLPDEASLDSRPLDDGGAMLGWRVGKESTAVAGLHLKKMYRVRAAAM